MTTVASDGADLIKLLLRRSWIMILVAILTGGLAFFLSSRQEPLYQSQTRMLIGNIIDSANPNQGAFDLSQRLAPVYLELLLSRENITATMETLDIDLPFDDFVEFISANVVADTPILIVTAQYNDPQVAANIANQLAQGLIDRAPSNLTEQQENRLVLINQQIDNLESQINSIQLQLDDVTDQIDEAEGIDFLNTQSLLLQTYNQLSAQITASQATLAQLLDTYLSLTQRVNTLEIIEPAQPIPDRVGISPIIIGIAGAIVGAILSAALLLLLEYTNSTIRSEVDLRSVSKYQLLAVLSPVRGIKQRPGRYAVVHEKSGSLIAENFRTLRTSLLYSREWSTDEVTTNRRNRSGTRVFSIASSHNGDGRSFVAANLAISMAETGAKVLLIDCNFRDPILHEVFNISNERGLVTLLLKLKANPAILQKDGATEFLESLVQVATEFGGVNVITAGASNNMQQPTLLGFEHIEQVIARLGEIGEYQVVLLDTSAALDYADSYTVTAKTDATVLLVTRANRTSYADLRLLSDQFEDIGVGIAGVVLNKV